MFTFRIFILRETRKWFNERPEQIISRLLEHITFPLDSMIE